MVQRKDSKDKLIIEVEDVDYALPFGVFELIEKLTELSKEFGSTLQVFPDEYGTYYIRYSREETDKEYTQRQALLQESRKRAELRQKKKQEKQEKEDAERERKERELYEQLKKKYS